MQNTTGSIGSAGHFDAPTSTGSALGRRPASQPANRLQNWIEQLDRLPLREAAQAHAKDFLQDLAQGHPQDPALAQAVFNALIEHEAYDLFVDVFLAHQHLGRSLAQTDGRPYTSTLCLQLPDGWTPRAPAAMASAFAQVRVDRLEVLQAPAPKSPVQGGAPAQTPVCAAVCEAILALLQSGTRELKLQAALADGIAVAKAIGASQQLESLSLGNPLGSGPVDPDEYGGYHQVILHGALACSSLRQLALHGREAVVSLALLLAMRQTSQLPWTSLTLGVRDDGADVNALFADLPRLLQRLPDLSALEIAASGLDVGTRARTLIIFAGAGALPQLRRFTCDLGPLTTSAAAAMRTLYAFEPRLLKDQAEVIRHTFQSPTFQLAEVVIKGYPWSPSGLRAMSEELVQNETLQGVDLSDGCLDSDSMADVTRGLAANGSLQEFKVPQKADNYYLMRPDEDIVEGSTLVRFQPGDVQAALDRRRARALLAAANTTTTSSTAAATNITTTHTATATTTATAPTTTTTTTTTTTRTTTTTETAMATATNAAGTDDA